MVERAALEKRWGCKTSVSSNLTPSDMKILAIETSCDETAIAVLEAKGGIKNPRFKILSNIVSSQVKIHAKWGGGTH